MSRKSIIKRTRVPRSTGTEFDFAESSNREIDEFYRIFRAELKDCIGYGDLTKQGKYYKTVSNQRHGGAMYLPKQKFSLTEIVESKRILKKLKMVFILLIKDWNNPKEYLKILRRYKIPKPILMTDLIFAAWKHDNEPYKNKTLWDTRCPVCRRQYETAKQRNNHFLNHYKVTRVRKGKKWR